MAVSVALSQEWSAAFPGARIGVLAMRGVVNPDRDLALDRRAIELQQAIQARFSGVDRATLLTVPTLRAYAAYYKRFGKTYHVQLQLESVAFKEKPISGANAIVQAMVLAELKSMLLTAGHDLEAVRGTLTVHRATGDEQYILLRGTEQTLKSGDMYIRDEEGILSSILYGPDRRTQLTPTTRSVLFTVYAPAGITLGELEAHLIELGENVRLFSPRSEIETCETFEAGGGS